MYQSNAHEAISINDRGTVQTIQLFRSVEMNTWLQSLFGGASRRNQIRMHSENAIVSSTFPRDELQ